MPQTALLFAVIGTTAELVDAGLVHVDQDGVDICQVSKGKTLAVHHYGHEAHLLMLPVPTPSLN